MHSSMFKENGEVVRMMVGVALTQNQETWGCVRFELNYQWELFVSIFYGGQH